MAGISIVHNTTAKSKETFFQQIDLFWHEGSWPISYQISDVFSERDATIIRIYMIPNNMFTTAAVLLLLYKTMCPRPSV